MSLRSLCDEALSGISECHHTAVLSALPLSHGDALRGTPAAQALRRTVEVFLAARASRPVTAGVNTEMNEGEDEGIHELMAEWRRELHRYYDADDCNSLCAGALSESVKASPRGRSALDAFVLAGRVLPAQAPAFAAALCAALAAHPCAVDFSGAWAFWESALVDAACACAAGVDAAALSFAAAPAPLRLRLIGRCAALCASGAAGPSPLLHRLLLAAPDCAAGLPEAELRALVAALVTAAALAAAALSPLDPVAAWLLRLVACPAAARAVAGLALLPPRERRAPEVEGGGAALGPVECVAAALHEPHGLAVAHVALPLWAAATHSTGHSAQSTAKADGHSGEGRVARLLDAVAHVPPRSAAAVACVARAARFAPLEQRLRILAVTRDAAAALAKRSDPAALWPLRLIARLAARDAAFRLPLADVAALERALLRPCERLARVSRAAAQCTAALWAALLRDYAAELPRTVSRVVRGVCAEWGHALWDARHIVAASRAAVVWRGISEALDCPDRAGALDYGAVLRHLCDETNSEDENMEENKQENKEENKQENKEENKQENKEENKQENKEENKEGADGAMTAEGAGNAWALWRCRGPSHCAWWLLTRWATCAPARRGLYAATTEALRFLAPDAFLSNDSENTDTFDDDPLPMDVEDFAVVFGAPHSVSPHDLRRARTVALLLSARLCVAAAPGDGAEECHAMLRAQLRQNASRGQLAEESQLALLAAAAISRLTGTDTTNDTNNNNNNNNNGNNNNDIECRGSGGGSGGEKALYDADDGSGGTVLGRDAAVPLRRFVRCGCCGGGGDPWRPSALSLALALSRRAEAPAATDCGAFFAAERPSQRLPHARNRAGALRRLLSANAAQSDAYARVAELATGVVRHLQNFHPHVEPALRAEGADAYVLALVCVGRWMRDEVNAPGLAEAAVTLFLQRGQAQFERAVANSLACHVMGARDATAADDGLPFPFPESRIFPISLLWAMCLTTEFVLIG